MTGVFEKSGAAGFAPAFRAVPRRPLVGVALLFLGGAGTGWLFEPGAGLPTLAGLACLLLSVAGPGWARQAFLFLAVFFAGWMRTATLASRLSPRHIGRHSEPGADYVRVIGRVADDPVLLRAGTARAVRSFTLDVEAAQREDWVTARGEVRAWLAESAAPPPRYGDRVEVAGRLRTAASPAALASLRIHSGSWRALGRGRAHPAAVLAYGARRRASETLRRGLERSPETAAIMTAMLLGLREDMPEDLVRAYRWTGMFHIFAISGLHVVMLCVLWIAWLQLIGLPRTRWVWVLAPWLAGYTLATGGSPSAVRAAVMTAIYYSASAVRRRPDAPSALALTAALNVAAYPRQMLMPSFIFSYSVVAALLMLMPLLPGDAPGGGKDSFQLGSPPFFSRVSHALARWALGLAWMSFVAWMASTPLSALYAGRISPGGLIGNLFIVPAAFAIVFIGCLSLAAGVFSPWIAEVFNHANGAWISLVNMGARAILEMPGAYVFMPRPSWIAVASWYVGWGSLFFLRGAWRRGVAGLSACVLMGLGVRAVSDRALRAEVFPSGPVATAVVRRPFRMTAVSDPGPDWLAHSLARNLRRSGIHRIDLLVLRVPLMDWSGAARSLAEEFDVREIWAPDTGARFPAFRAMLEDLEAKGVPVRRRVAGDRGTLAGGVEADVFYPPPAMASRRASAYAMTLRLAWEDRSILLLGPLESGILSAAAQAGPAAASAEWLAAVGAGDPAEWSGLLDLFAPREVRFLIPDDAALGREWTDPLSARGIRWRRPGRPGDNPKENRAVSEWPGKAPWQAPRIPDDPAADRIPGE